MDPGFYKGVGGGVCDVDVSGRRNMGFKEGFVEESLTYKMITT